MRQTRCPNPSSRRNPPALEPLEGRRLLATFTVTTNADSGAGSLRSAITAANAAAGADTIRFNIAAGGAQTIALGSALPVVSGTLAVDGTTQGGYVGSPLVAVVGTTFIAGDGLRLNAAGCSIRGLVVSGFDGFSRAGVRVTGNADGSTLSNCWLGTDATGAAADRNWFGVVVEAGADDVTIGGAAPGDRNVIAGNFFNGVDSPGAKSNLQVLGNYVGTTAAGDAALGNGNIGLQAQATASTFRGNVISGNVRAGIALTGSGNTIRGNRIGVAAEGVTPLGNGLTGPLERDGVILNGSNNVIGGTGAGDANVIANNAGHGIRVNGGSGNSIRGNSVFANGALGINLAGGNEDGAGVTANDDDDLDTGANDLQNAPAIASVLRDSAGGGTISGALDAAPSTAITVDFFAGADGEGQTLLGSALVNTDGAGTATFSFPYAAVAAQPVITATATDPAGNTSEFAAGVPEVPDPADAPVAAADAFVGDEDAVIAGGVLGNDSDPNGDTLAAVLHEGPSHGTLDLQPDGSFAYTPEPDFFGSDSFLYRVSDGSQDSAPAHVSLTINPVSDPSVFRFATDAYSVSEDWFVEMTVVRDTASDFAEVAYEFEALTATAGADFSPGGGVLSFVPGQTARSINVFPEFDLLEESPETFRARLVHPSAGASVGDPGTATVTILDDPPPPGITVSDPEPAAEGDAGGSTVNFILTLSKPSDQTVTVEYETSFGTAVGGEDYRPASGEVTFEPGQTSAVVPVAVLGDTDNEFDESLSLLLLFSSEAMVVDGFAFTNILNDDNVAPAASSPTVTRVPGAGPVEVGVGSIVASPDGDVLTVFIKTQPARGFAAYDDGGTPLDTADDVFTYTPAGSGLAGDDSFTYEVVDAFGGRTTGTVMIESRGAAALANPADPAKSDLVLAATPAADAVRFVRTRVRGEVRVTVNGVDQGVFSPTGRVVIAGGDGDDVIDARKLALGVDLIGGAGDDTLRGGRGADLILGGPGDDTLAGGDRRDVLVGGGGADRLAGGGDDDLLIAGAVTFGGDLPADALFRADLVAAWTAPGDRDARLTALLEGTGTRGVHLGTDNLADDAAPDLLSGNGGADWFLAATEPVATRDRFKAEFGTDDFTEI